MKSAGRASNDRSHRTQRGAASDVAPSRRRRSAVVVIEDPRIVVVESATVADPAALDNALELLVKWGVRAHKRGHHPQTDAPNGENSTTYGPEN